MNNTIYLYVFDTMADWEIGYLTAELNSGRYFKKGLAKSRVVTVALEKTPIVTMGGLKILPDATLDECGKVNPDALILPGGNTWMEPMHQPVLKMAERYLEEGILVAAICGATIGLAQAGLLDSRYHTSNDLGYLKMVCPTYKGETYYKTEPAILDQGLITASGVAPLEFSALVIKALDVFSAQTMDAWYHLYKTAEEKYFYALMDSMR